VSWRIRTTEWCCIVLYNTSAGSIWGDMGRYDLRLGPLPLAGYGCSEGGRVCLPSCSLTLGQPTRWAVFESNYFVTTTYPRYLCRYITLNVYKSLST